MSRGAREISLVRVRRRQCADQAVAIRNATVATASTAMAIRNIRTLMSQHGRHPLR